MRHYPASNLTPLHPNSLQQIKPKGAVDWTSLINDELAYVMDNGTLRIYKFVAASVLASNIPDVVIPDGNLTGVGAWEKQAFDGVGGGGTALIDFIETDDTNYTLRRFENPDSMPQGDGITSGIQSNPTWEGDIWKNQVIVSDSGIGYSALLYLSSTGWQPARANAENTLGRLGLNLNPTATSPGEIFIRGTINHVNITGLTGALVGQTLYVSVINAGRISNIKPVALEYVQEIGHKIDDTTIWFDPTPKILEGVAGGE